MELSKYLDVFIEEAKENLQNLNEGLLKLGEGQTGVIDEVFRSAHTLKGMAATMGFGEVAELTHAMENIFDLLRRGDQRYTEGLGDVLFACLDGIEAFINEVGADYVPKIKDYGALLESLSTSSSPTPVAAQPIAAAAPMVTLPPLMEINEYEQSILQAAQKRGFHAFYIVVRLRPDCLLKSVRAFMVFQALERAGEIVKSNPPVTAIEDEQFDSSFELIVVSQQTRETIAQALNSISELEQVDVVAYTLDAPKEARNEQIEQPEEQTRAGGGSDMTKKLKTGKTVRVDINRLDGLMNLMSELVINKTRLSELSQEIAHGDLNEATNQLNRISGELQNLIMQVRMVPIEQVFNRFPRMVRDLARELNKEIDLVVLGQETELDRTVIDEIGEPILHLVRNAVDHGIEGPELRRQRGKPTAGTVRLSAFPHGHTVVIEVEDDGKGIDPEAVARKAVERGFLSERELGFMDQQERLMLIFQPGFSTADKVSDVSGRGVGLDVVKTQVESLGGTVDLVTSSGQGSKFVISLPLTLAILQSLLVQSGPERYAIPLSSIDQTFSLLDTGVKTVRGQEVTMYRGHILPLIRLRRLLDVPQTGQPSEGSECYVVVLKRNDKMLGLVVDELVGHQEIVIKTMGKYLGNAKGIAGATILGNGQIALILDVPSLF